MKKGTIGVVCTCSDGELKEYWVETENTRYSLIVSLICNICGAETIIKLDKKKDRLYE